MVAALQLVVKYIAVPSLSQWEMLEHLTKMELSKI